MIAFNITLVIQGFNFIIAYILLDKLLLRHVFAKIISKQQVLQELNKDNFIAQTELKKIQMLLQHTKHDLKESYTNQAPKIENQALLSKNESIQIIKTKQDLQKNHTIAKSIFGRIMHAN